MTLIFLFIGTWIVMFLNTMIIADAIKGSTLYDINNDKYDDNDYNR